METQRQHKYARQLLKDLVMIFQRTLRDSFNGAFVTLTDVKISPDLSVATTYVSVFPAQRGKEVITIINANNKRIRGILGKKIGKQARIVPLLKFIFDDTQEKASKMEVLIGNLKTREEIK